MSGDAEKGGLSARGKGNVCGRRSHDGGERTANRKAEAERVYQGRGAMSRRFLRARSSRMGHLSSLLLLFGLLSSLPALISAAEDVVPEQSLAVLPGVNISSYDETIQLVAFTNLVRLGGETGIIYPAAITTGVLANVTIKAVRLRVGSLRRRGLSLGHFTIPPGVRVNNTSILRVILVYREFGNVSVYSSPLPHQALVSPVVGIKVYDGDSLSSIEPLPPLVVSVLQDPIQVAIPPTPRSSPYNCVAFNDDGTTSTHNVSAPSYTCSANFFGDFALVGKPAPGKKSNAWKIALGTVLGVLGLIAILSILAFFVRRQLRRRQIAKMQFQVDHGETLRSHLIGNSRAPVANGTRTRPTLEKDYLEA